MSSSAHHCFYIGDVIRQKVDEAQISHAEFAREIGCARTSLYRIFNSKSIDIERLITISKVLHFDFIQAYYKTNTQHLKHQQPGILIPWVNGKLSISDLPNEIKSQLLNNLLKEKENLST